MLFDDTIDKNNEVIVKSRYSVEKFEALIEIVQVLVKDYKKQKRINKEITEFMRRERIEFDTSKKTE